MESRLARFWTWWAALSLRRPWEIAFFGIAVFAVCLPFAARLYGDLRTDLRELLPHGAPAAVGLEELEKRIGGLSSLALVVRTDDLKAGERFVDAVAKRLKALPPSLVARVHWRVDAEREFLDRHGALYADLRDLQMARDANTAGDRVAAENYLQHAEHYWRIMAANQPQQPYQPHAMNGGQPSGNGRDPAQNGSAPSFSLADGGNGHTEEESDDAVA